MHTAESNAPLAIVGIGCLFPKAAGPGFFWANAKHAADCIGPVPPTHWNPDEYFDADPKAPDMTYARRGGFLSPVDFNPMEFGIAPRDIEATDTSQLLGLVAAKQALVDAGIRFADRRQETGDRSQEDKTRGSSLSPGSCPLSPSVERDRVSVILGVTGTLELVIPLGARLGHPKWRKAMKDAGIPDDAADDAAARIAESYVPWQENSFPGLLGNVVAGRIANKLDLGGTNCVVDAACASSLSAVHLAALELQAGRADVVVTGGADTFNDIFMYMCFSKTPALSPSGDAKPFDADGDGTILGEGIGVVVLKRLSDAERDGDTVYAVIKGIGSSSDGKGNAIYAPSANGQKKALRNAYALAGVTPDTIELVEAHGTGTKVGDTVEITALTEVYNSGDREQETGDSKAKDAGSSLSPVSCSLSPVSRPWCAIGSVKSQIGHTKAAAGSASLIKAALALHYKVLPPTIKVTQPVEPLRAADSPFYVNAEMRPWLPRAEHPRRAALSAFGFGGSNFHAVLEEHRPQKAEVDWDGSVEVVALSADTPQQLAAALDQLPASWDDFARAAEQTRTAFKGDAPCRLCFAAHRTLTDLPKLIAGAKAKLGGPPAESWHTPEGVHFGSGPAGELAVLFPGQGSQYVGMLRELACLFPESLDSLAEANAAVAARNPDDTDARRISDHIYPPTTFDAARKTDNDRSLRDTRNAQPALGAVSFGAWRVLNERFGVTAEAFAGHSYGELVALTAAGRFGATDLFAMSRVRGELMAGQRDGDPGSMIAVLAPHADIAAVMKDKNLGLVVANHNAPKQTVLSGSTSEVERAEKAFHAAGVRFARLPVAAAFHSEFVSDAAPPFRAALDAIEWKAGNVSVFANTTAAEYPADADAARDLLANQLARPVAFVEQVCAMIVAGVRTFVEVGPGNVLTRLVEAILAETPSANAEAFALDASGGKRSGALDLGNVLARLAARGHAVRLSAWEHESRCRPPAKPAKLGQTIAICGANYVTPRTPRPAATPFSLNAPSKAPGMPESDPNAIAQALLMTQQSLAALQRMQEQTAQLHQQFLDSQESAQRTLQALVDQQQTLLLSGLGGGVALPPVPVMPPPPPRVAPKPVAPTVVVPPAVVPPVGAKPAPVPPTPKPVTPPAPKPAAPKRDNVAAALLAVVSEKTGYAVDNLDLSLSLDGDLGIDSIKRVEILSALQERLPDAPVVKPEHLGTLHTLQDVADFLGRRATPMPSNPATTKIPFVSADTATDSSLFTVAVTPQLASAELVAPDTEQVSNIRPQQMPESVAENPPKPAPRNT
ncbi:MAG TPA: beta-ketoacyl synthase N-terminal-like domain-containing protein, partial [Gemmataceae bacterium]|nr:beta-ketoacyl synthase N-terminal-like domain-containing protein [Gemmataceae bacterium]